MHHHHATSGLAATLQGFSGTAIVLALAIIYFWFGGMKFTAYEAGAISGLVSNHPGMSWLYSIFSQRAFGTVLGIVEVTIGALILARFFNPKLSALGGMLSTILFAGTLSFMLTTPGVTDAATIGAGFPAITVMPGQFLLKDLGLLAASLWVWGDSLAAVQAYRG